MANYLQVHFTPGEKQALSEAANNLGITMKDFVKTAIGDYLNKSKSGEFERYANAERTLTTEDVAKILSVEPQTVRRLAIKGKIPKPISPTAKIRRWSSKSISDYLNQVKQPTETKTNES